MGNVGKALIAPLSSPKEAIKAINPVYVGKKYAALQDQDKAEAEAKAAAEEEKNSPYNLGKQALEAQIALAPQQYEMEAKYRPLYTDLENQLLRQTMLGENGTLATMREAVPIMSEIDAASNSAARKADLADVQALGTGYSEAIRAANPQLTGVQNSLYDRAVNGSEIMRTLESQSLADLQKGGYLNPDELRQVQQGVRSAYGSRGLSGSSAAAMAEALQRTKYVDERKAGAQGRALAVDTARNQLIGQTGQLLANTSVDPVKAILGRDSTATNQTGTAFSQSAYSTSSNPTLFDPYDSQIMNIFSGNQATKLAYLTNAANNRSAMDTAAINGVSNIAGSVLGAF